MCDKVVRTTLFQTMLLWFWGGRLENRGRKKLKVVLFCCCCCCSLVVVAMPDLREALGNAVRNSFCAAAGAVGGAAGLVGDSVEALTGSGGGFSAAAGAIEGARAIACNTPTNPANIPDPPFTGGQCPGGVYQVGLVMAPGGTYVINNVVGPIQSIDCEPFGAGSRILINGAQVQASTNALRACPIDQTNIVRTDGQPDDCGDPGVPVTPYDPGDWTENPSVDFDDDGGNPVNINPTLIFAPVTVAVDGTVNVPVTVNFNDGSSLFGDFNLSTGDIQFGGGGNGGEGQEPKPVRDDDSVEGDDPNNPEDELADPIIAVLVKVTNVTNAKVTEIPATGGGAYDLTVPRLGWISFYCLIADGGGKAWTKDIDVRNRVQITECPIPWGAVNVDVQPATGVTLSYTALRGKTTRQLLLESSVGS